MNNSYLKSIHILVERLKDDPLSFSEVCQQFLTEEFSYKTWGFVKDFSIELIQSDCYKGKSLIHENGFTKISLFKCNDTGIQLRLHIWPKSTYDSYIHNHRWDLASYCIYGKMLFTNYIMTPHEKSPYNHHHVFDADNNLKKQKKYISSVKPLIANKYEIKENSFHYLHSSILHSAYAIDDSVTLFISGPENRDYSDVLYDTSEYPSRKSIDINEAINLISGISL